MAKNRSKWIFLAILIGVISVGIAYALTKPNIQSDPNPSTNGLSNSGNRGGGLGNGTLYVYTDVGRTIEAPKDEEERYLVLCGRLYYFRITGIAEYAVGQTIHVWAHYNDSNYLIGDCVVGSGGTIDFDWLIPTLPYETEIKYKYGLSLTGRNSDWRFAKRTTHGVALTLVIPQVQFGALGAMSAFTVAYSIKVLSSKKRFF